MLRKGLIAVGLTMAILATTVAVLYIWNATPAVPAVTAEQAANPSRPYVVKLHARWCPVCMTTTGAWSTIASEYGSRVNLVVFDLTNEETTRASRAEAVRLGLERFFDEAGGTGSVVVLDSRTKDITAWIDGSRDLAEYRSAIDDALAGSKTPSGS